MLLLVPLLAACADGQPYGGGAPDDQPTSASYAEFESSVYPVLLRDCAFSECHGGKSRFFQVYGPGRVRIDPMLKPADPATPAEIMHSYARALSMLVTDAQLDRSLLLRKPLEPKAGGQGHKGMDLLGRNVYRSKNDPDYVVIATWARHAIEAAASGSGSNP